MAKDPKDPQKPAKKGPKKLPPQQVRRRRKLTEAELDQLAEITPEDIEDAKASWRRNAPPEFRDLLDAAPIPLEGEDGPVSGES